MRRTLAALLVLVATTASADEGMWTYNNFPSKAVQQAYGFEPTPAWLDKARLASARLARGCSASFVSPDGLVMTNHHCARGCIDELSSAKRDLIKNGFYAATAAQELKCPDVEVNQLLEIRDVTEVVQKATAGLQGEQFQAARKAALAKLEKDCAGGDVKIRCDVVSLYNGGQHHLYKYGRHQDVRLVFAPENQIAFFGGDPDNFEYPRYTLDVSFFRVYENNKPAKIEHYFRWSENGAQKDQLTFVTGNPGRTSRLKTIAQLEYERDFALPERLMYLAEVRGMITEFQNRGPEQTRISNNMKFGIENSYKALKGRREALVDDGFFAQKIAEEKALREKVDANPEMKKQYGQAWSEIAQALQQQEALREDLQILERGAGGGSDLFGIARTLYRAADELPKPNEQRLREFSDARLPSLKQSLFSTAPIYPELEQTLLTFYFTKLRETLGPDHPAVREVLGKESPESLAKKLVTGTKLRNVKARQALWDGGEKAVDTSKDPMIAVVRVLDPFARALRKTYEDDIEAKIARNEELIARARFQVYGTSIYPDATFSPRLSYGSVKGWSEGGRQIPPMTVIGGTFERATGKDPFALPPSWLKGKSKLELQTPMNFVTTNDIIGGNSGSPVINKDLEIVGLIFDGNIHSLGGEYGFDASKNRAVAVHSEAIVESLDKIYNAKRLLQELQPKADAAKGAR